MKLDSRALAFLVAISVAGITTAFLYLLPEISNAALVITFILSFATSFILVRLVAEFLFFREINYIYEALAKIQSEELAKIGKKNNSSFNPLRKINSEIQDYVQKKQAEIKSLKEMETFRREFIADVSHELKTPIFAAQGFVHTLLDGAVEDKKVRLRFLKKAARSLDGLDILVQELLTISQMEIGQIKMHYELFDMVDLCNEVFDQLEGKAEKREISVSFEKQYDIPILVYADYQRIYQVMTNLITNGINYTKKGGYVKVGIKNVQGNKIKVSVSDNGRGIPEDDIHRIFERFYRVEKSRSKEKGGTGLGLSIVKHIMEAHQTKIEVISELGIGSTFCFILDAENKQSEIRKTEAGENGDE